MKVGVLRDITSCKLTSRNGKLQINISSRLFIILVQLVSIIVIYYLIKIVDSIMSQVPMFPYKVQTYRGVVDTHKTVLPLENSWF